MATPTQSSALPKSDQLEHLAAALEAAAKLYGSAKNYARLSLEDPANAARCIEAARQLTGPLRQIQALA